MITNITMGPSLLNDWLKKQWSLYHINEIEIETDKTNTIMTIKLKSEEFPNYD